MDTTHNTRHRPMPLEGIKIVEYGVFRAGLGAGVILGDLGADVVKIESGLSDPERYWNIVSGETGLLDSLHYHWNSE
jgi:crotonobetainyl-CoA:carnitine CoA-transferase CaiB-like acyl-CoA transferase